MTATGGFRSSVATNPTCRVTAFAGVTKILHALKTKSISLHDLPDGSLALATVRQVA